MTLVGAWSGWRLRTRLPQVRPTASSHPPRLEFQSDALTRAPALFSWRLRVDARHSAARRFTVHLPQHSLALEPDWPRGRYEVTALWELADWFGFTQLTVPPRESTVLTIEPGQREFRPAALPERQRGTARPRRVGRREGEPFDVRHYVPGDDLRRLHWPLYAHSNNLFVRAAEPIPPPTGHQFVVLDLSAANEEQLDTRLELLRGWLSELDASGSGWTVAVPAARLTLRSGDGSALAALSPAPLPLAVDASWPESVSVLTGSEAAIAPLVNELIRSRRRVRPLVAPSDAAPARRVWWRRP